MQVTSSINKTNLKIINSFMQNALVKSVDNLKQDVIDEQVMPFDIGHMQNEKMFVDDSKIKIGIVLLVVDTPYTRRLYFHPEYNFKTDKNPNAKGEWFEEWINGNKKLYLSITFARLLRKEFQKYETKGN